MGMLGCESGICDEALGRLKNEYGQTDIVSEIWRFDHTEYYREQTGPDMVRQFVSFERLIAPDELAGVKLRTNQLERDFAADGRYHWPRPINLDPGIVEPSKLVLASTKNFAHRIYIGSRIYAEVTLMYQRGRWVASDYTFPDFRVETYYGFLDKVREKLVSQLRQAGPTKGRDL